MDRTQEKRALDSRIRIWRHPTVEITASSFRLRPNAPEGRKGFPIKSFSVLLLGALLVVGCKGSPSNKGLDAAGLDVEPGLRLRVYSLGEGFDPTLPLLPGQSANVDLTVDSVLATEQTVYRDIQAITAAGDERIDNHYIAEWTGWVKAPKAGTYTFHIDSNAPTQLSINEQRIIDNRADLRAGWHSIRLVQRVASPAQRAIRMTWTMPGDEGQAPQQPNSDLLRAPAFYFRPIQAGRKTLVAGNARPGLGKKLETLHPGYRLTNIRPGGMEMPVGGLGMLSDGRLVVARFDATTLVAPRPTEKPNGELWLIHNPNADDPAKITGRKIAETLYEPSGVFVIDDEIYVSQRHEITKYTYNPAADRWNTSVIATGWETTDFHQISAGLPHIPGPSSDHPGFFYMSRGAALGTGRNPPDHASVWKIDLSKHAGENVEVLTGGHRTPNGIGLNKQGEAFVIDNQGGWTPANEINHIQKGKFYGYYLGNHPEEGRHPSPYQPETQDNSLVMQPAIQLPQDEIGNSPTELLLFPDGTVFEGQLAVGDMRYGGINRVMLEEVNSVWQGAAMRFTQGLEAGPNRIYFGPDGSLYVGGIGGRHASTWYWVNDKGEPTYQGLERLTPTGEEVFEILDMRATPTGFVLNFTQPVPMATLADPANYTMAQWTYIATNQYGGPKIDEQELKVTSAVPSDDLRSVTLTIPGLLEGYVVYLRTDPISLSGKAIWSGEVWYTLNQIPRR
jgi:hypothetical protein